MITLWAKFGQRARVWHWWSDASNVPVWRMELYYFLVAVVVLKVNITGSLTAVKCCNDLRRSYLYKKQKTKTKEQGSCHMCLALCRCTPVAEVPASPPLRPRLLVGPPPSSLPSLLPPPPPSPGSTCSGSSGWAWARQTSNTCSAPPYCCRLPPPLPPPTHHSLPSLAISLFSPFVQPVLLSGRCVIYSSLGDMWSLRWIPRTPGSQCCFGGRGGGGGREGGGRGEEGKQSDTSSQLSGRSVQVEEILRGEKKKKKKKENSD